jgi:hypothetical protein
MAERRQAPQPHAADLRQRCVHLERSNAEQLALLGEYPCTVLYNLCYHTTPRAHLSGEKQRALTRLRREKQRDLARLRQNHSVELNRARQNHTVELNRVREDHRQEVTGLRRENDYLKLLFMVTNNSTVSLTIILLGHRVFDLNINIFRWTTRSNGDVCKIIKGNLPNVFSEKNILVALWFNRECKVRLNQLSPL